MAQDPTSVGSNTVSGDSYFGVATQTNDKSCASETTFCARRDTVVFHWDKEFSLWYLLSGTDSFEFQIIDKGVPSSDDIILKVILNKADITLLHSTISMVATLGKLLPSRRPQCLFQRNQASIQNHTNKALIEYHYNSHNVSLSHHMGDRSLSHHMGDRSQAASIGDAASLISNICIDPG